MAKGKTGEPAKDQDSKENEAKPKANKVSKDLERRLNRGFVQVLGTGKGAMKKGQVYTVSVAAAEYLIDKGSAK